MIGGIVFLVGLVGLLLFTALLVWETAHNKKMLPSVRARSDRLISKTYHYLVFGEISRSYRGTLIFHARRMTHQAIHLLAALLRAVERPLARTSRRMQHSHESGNGEVRTPSPFLKDIVDDKRKNGKNSQDPL